MLPLLWGEEVVGTLVATIVDRCGYSLGDPPGACPLTDVDAPRMLLVSSFEGVLVLVSETQPSDEAEAARAVYRPEREVSAPCVGPVIMTDLRARSVRPASVRAVPRLLIDWSTRCSSRAAAGHAALSGC